MVLGMVAIGVAVLPFLNMLLKERVSELGDWLTDKVTGGVSGKFFAGKITKAIEKGDIEGFIAEHKDSLTEPIIQEIRTLARLRVLSQKAQHQIERKRYTEASGEVFRELATIVAECTRDTPLGAAGIKNLVVKDVEEGREFPVGSTDYLVALLQRFACAVNTQLARQLTPEQKGWALEYDASLSFRLRKPSKVRGTLTDVARSIGEAIAFRKAYTRLIEQYRLAKRIGEFYQDAGTCIQESLRCVQGIKGSQKIHPFMGTQHLEGLALGLEGETKFWQFMVTSELPQLLGDVYTAVEGDARRIREYLRDIMDVTQEEMTEFWDCLMLYEDIESGIADALKLYEQAAELCSPGRDATLIAQRIREIKQQG